MNCPVCGQPAVVLVRFTTGGQYPYCRRHAYRRGKLVWNPKHLLSVQRLMMEEETEEAF